MLDSKIHLMSLGYSRANIALQVQNRGHKHHSFTQHNTERQYMAATERKCYRTKGPRAEIVM